MVDLDVGDGRPRSGFRAMVEGTAEDWQAIGAADRLFARSLPDFLIAQLNLLADERHAFPIDRLQHNLQTATRAARDGRDEEYVVCALLHDIGAALAPENHGVFASTILRPYVSEPNFWMVLHHDVFQGYYFRHFFGGDRDQRERFRGHPHFERTAQFCHLYDQSSFDPDYDTLPLSAFEPALRRVLSPKSA